MKVALIQSPCILGDKDANLSKMESVLSSNDADVFVFAELFLTGYMVRDAVFELAEEMEGESVGQIAKLAAKRDCWIVFGMALRHPELSGVITNSAVAVGPDGQLHRYDKVNLANFGPFEEGLYFRPGGVPQVFSIGEHKVGLMICYDVFFSELARHYAMQGADLMIAVSASPTTSRRAFETLLPARAVESTCYFAYVNQVGSQLNQVFFGGSQAYGPTGRLLSRNAYYREDVSVIEVEREQLEIARRSRPTVRDGWSSTE
jgi:predicted amidohydrolase